ncbi:MAG: hypothetical protein KDK23_13090 [Leptospiraceae bacterium]|nr:hypothetical protein [Leptospiraceae bacterium]
MIIASPGSGMSIFRDRIRILDVQRNLARALLDRGEDLLILEPPNLPQDWKTGLPRKIFRTFDTGQVWLRDLAPVVGGQVCAFADGYPRNPTSGSRKRSVSSIAQGCKTQFLDFLNSQGAVCETFSSLIVDAGHVLYNYGSPGNRIALVSHRVARLNPGVSFLHERLRTLLGVDRLIFVPDPGEDEGRLDGTMCFLEPNVLMIQNAGPQGRCLPAARSRWDRISAYLSRLLPDVQQFIFNWPAGEGAFGLYANCIVTDQTVYVPHYEMPGDFLILERMQEHTGKELVAIDVWPLARLGRMAWQPPAHWASLIYDSGPPLSDQVDLTRKNSAE